MTLRAAFLRQRSVEISAFEATSEEEDARLWSEAQKAADALFGPALTFERLAAVNAERCDRWHHGFPSHPKDSVAWSGADWSNAMQGEAGEAGNIVKKLRRLELDLWGNRKTGDTTRDELVAKLGEEIADTIIYADLLATYYGVDLEGAIVEKFNRISIEADFPERLP